MRISKLTIQGYKSFGNSPVEINIDEELTAFIGLNSCGKTTVLDALRKMFGTSSERELYRQDFHIGKDENIADIDFRNLSIEVKLDFSEEEKESIPSFFNHMVVDEEGAEPYVRVRLESTWKKSKMIQEGEIETCLYIIDIAEGEKLSDENKHLYPNHLRKLIQMMYVPAIRRPSDQIRYTSGTILYRVLRRLNWTDEFKDDFKLKIEVINEAFKELPEFNNVQGTINSFWQRFHKDERYKDINIGFGGSDLDSILKKIEVTFSPSGTHKNFTVDELGEGYRSLFYLTLVCALLDIEENQTEDDGVVDDDRPLLTILAIEEPENHIAPQLLGRIIKILLTISQKANSQVLISSHTPTIVKRIDPLSIRHLRINEKYQTEVNEIILPKKSDEINKYVREAIHNYPEIYFAKLVVIGEGDSEDIIFNRFMDITNNDFDDNIITFAPLGHRFVNHIWRLLQNLHIPFVTLLDLDVDRDGGGWGRIKYALMQLIKIKVNKDILLTREDNSIMTYEELEEMHKLSLSNKADMDALNYWVKKLKGYNIFYSAPLDLDFLMLKHYTEFYKKTASSKGGPRIPDKVNEMYEFNKKVETAIQATLKSTTAIAANYSDDEKELIIWYNYLFLGRGKPSTHISALSLMNDSDIEDNIPIVLLELFDLVSSIVNPKEEDDEDN